MNPIYAIRDTATIFSPALIFYKELIQRNIERTVEIAGDPSRLRPHVKTHKTREIVQMERQAGITKHKCATPAEAEMLAQCGVPDILLAYNLVGPNCGRMARLMQAFPNCRFSVLADHPKGAHMLSAAMAGAGLVIDVLLDIDPGQHRTGIAPGAAAVALYEMFGKLPGLRPGGIHLYDGHNHQESRSEREAAVQSQLHSLLQFRKILVDEKRLPVPRLVVGGTPTFPIYASLDLPDMECAPGTCILHDNGYGSRFLDIKGYTPAAALLTRVISRPTANRITLDLGYKAVASDPPAGERCILLNVPNYEPVLQNEEHFVVETPSAHQFEPGDEVYAIPTHICPTSALHRFAYVVEKEQVVDKWEIVARDRVLNF
ncbi:MAG TPA: D-TA family PLP-dependent enzyme [Gemmataceae bacterium]|nr:D-TA family PLP-dependent enzyme [Gemmataceae bacterium]